MTAEPIESGCAGTDVHPSSGPQPLTLLMAGHTAGKRSAVTCALKCANACAHPIPNESDNPTFREIAGTALNRRKMFGLAGAGALAVTIGPAALGAAAAPAAPAALAAAPVAAPAAAAAARPPYGSRNKLAFTAIPTVGKDVDAFTVPAGYAWETLIRWGDPVLPGAPVFDINNQTAAAQAKQFGYNNDYTDIIATDSTGKKAVLVCNHEYVNAGIMFPPTLAATEAVKIAKAAHGLSVVELARSKAGDRWKVNTSAPRLNRRITADTPFHVDGPAAGSELLKTKDDPTGTVVLGTLGNCSGGTTPWGTVLSGEENFNGYFRATGTSEGDKRYGLKDAPTSYNFESVDPRFDARNPDYANEPHRFGWIIELDPLDPTAAPVKHTMLGRLKHEGANVIVADSGQVVAYTGDDERFDYLYKFVSEGTVKRGQSAHARTHNKSLLSSGSLYVAKFIGDSPLSDIDGSGVLPADGAFDGSGVWVPLVENGESRIKGMSTEEVLVFTRIAADKAGATKMDRCEDVQPSLATGKVYVVCTNNTDRGKPGKEAAVEPNPRNFNKDGHIVEITERGDDNTALRFDWNLVLVAGDPTLDSTYFAGFPKDKVSPISCPDNIAFDSQNNLWIATDGAPSGLGQADGLFKMPLAGPERGHVQQFLAVPRDAETCGPVVHDTEGLVYVAVQHPGEDGTWDAPNSYFPDYVTGTPAPGQFKGPRPAVVQVYKK